MWMSLVFSYPKRFYIGVSSYITIFRFFIWVYCIGKLNIIFKASLNHLLFIWKIGYREFVNL